MTFSKSPAGSGGSGITAVDVDGDSGQARLNELGYKQELRREMVRFYGQLSFPCFFFLLLMPLQHWLIR
jgi:hypothetical protein